MVDNLYATPNPSNILDLINFTNTMTGNMFGLFGLVAIWFVIFIAQKEYNTERAFASASMVTTMAGIPLSMAGFVPFYTIIPLVVMVVISIFILKRGE